MVFRSHDEARQATETCLHFGVDDIQAKYRELKEKGVTFHGEPQRHDWGGIMVGFSDPDGNRHHLVQYPN
jgi:uncharacterized glyoxalase superfamily protein PhnB